MLPLELMPTGGTPPKPVVPMLATPGGGRETDKLGNDVASGTGTGCAGTLGICKFVTGSGGKETEADEARDSIGTTVGGAPRAIGIATPGAPTAFGRAIPGGPIEGTAIPGRGNEDG